jgi:hypothetical protein
MTRFELGLIAFENLPAQPSLPSRLARDGETRSLSGTLPHLNAAKASYFG